MRASNWLNAAVAVALTMNVDLVAGFWRLPCRGRSGAARVDPLMSPGEISQHVHVVAGGKNFAPIADQESLMKSECTSCAVTQDKSAYWAPGLYFIYPNGTAELVQQEGGMLVYYLLYGQNIKAFPNGFRMIAGDSTKRNFTGPIPDLPKSQWGSADEHQNELAEKAIGFNCLNYATNPEPSLYRHEFPKKDFIDANCPDGIRAELMFPSCWNGKDVDSENHKDHVAYPSLVMDGECPKGYETRIVSLFYETIWNTGAFKDVEGTFSFANGDPTGNGYHGDMIMGWEEDFLQQAVDTCTNPSGEVEDCPLFDIQSDNDQIQCHFDVPSDLLDEDVLFHHGLPGGLQLSWGPEPQIMDMGSVISSLLPSLAPSPSPSPSPFSPSVSSVVSSSATPTLAEPASSSASSSAPGLVLPSGFDFTPVAKLGEAAPAPTTTSELSIPSSLIGKTAAYEVVVVEEDVFVTMDNAGKVLGTSSADLKTLYTSSSTGIITAPSTAPEKREVHPHAHKHIHGRRGVGHNH
ncbi:hypothetical protein PVAR5_0406 [Paecilomyces variotii No. 5]|uniref:DUF1996 domain-containing protein n=1 Tax=Byssochlamys spectabilis (strain No. 5 / NBRC 109023) TaxID=1356009 RepID=V5HR77_BYSSN|nr:hypothetical protein PVAR5_0406 [Paecilomyces variotii No. 5]